MITIEQPVVSHIERGLGTLWRGECTLVDPDAVFPRLQAIVEVIMADPTLELHLDAQRHESIAILRLVDQHGAVQAVAYHAWPTRTPEPTESDWRTQAADVIAGAMGYDGGIDGVRGISAETDEQLIDTIAAALIDAGWRPTADTEPEEWDDAPEDGE